MQHTIEIDLFKFVEVGSEKAELSLGGWVSNQSRQRSWIDCVVAILIKGLAVEKYI